MSALTDLSKSSILTCGIFISRAGAGGGAWAGGWGLGNLIADLMDVGGGGRTFVCCGGGGGIIELIKFDRPASGLDGGGGATAGAT